MKNSPFIILLVCLLMATGAMAQNEEDVLRYSTPQITGTARYVGMAGAYGAIGADFSSISTNPAGLGLYKKSEFTITPSIVFNNAESAYGGSKMDDGRNRFALGNVGIVLTGTPANRLDRSPVVNYQAAFGLNRVKDFNQRVIIKGVNNQNSLLDTYVEYAGNQNPESLNRFDTRPAFDTYLIDTLIGVSPLSYVNAYDYFGGFTSALQQKSIETKGSMNEVVLSGGINLNDRVYLGLTFGFPYFRYEQISIYREFNQTENRDLDNFRVRENLETKGSGFNIKFGAIVKATPQLRVGAAFHTPTWFNNITDKWSTSTRSEFANGDNYTAGSPLGEFQYDIKTPWRVSASAAYLLGRIGLVSADYEYVDYTSARLRPSVDFSDKNELIRNNFTQTHNFRVGAEFFVGVMQVRGGYAYQMSPFSSDVNDGMVQMVSGGLGYRNADFFIDAALAYSFSDMTNYLYSSYNYSAAADVKYSNYNFMLTLGFRFN
ncbi:MAG TPA: hypothetical protein VFC92_11535 [Bacteroidales bacterium]|nr:hypothetical protein [Bacteroidales bacterium]